VAAVCGLGDAVQEYLLKSNQSRLLGSACSALFARLCLLGTA